MTQEQIELLKFISDSGEEGVSVEDVSDWDDISTSTAYKRLAILRKYDWAKRIRTDDGGLVHILAPKGKEVLDPKVKNKPNHRGVMNMAISVKISEDLVECLEDLMSEEDLTSYSEAVDFALADYFGLVEEAEEEPEELEER